MRNEKVFRYLGLAAKAGKVASGEFQTENALKKGRAGVVLIADDASGNTKKKFADMCSFRGVPYFMIADKAALGHQIGKEMRSSAAVTDENLANAIINTMRETFPEND
ncbi:MAG: ribosomal L7Ae/L30e/S12e/Gadd45 family protein [Lachnospiraceae bacterium]|nr:ribosomal L7Ae/L30e/S12e/Gadd45 family protein [Lachnospiraceae bacterium]